MSAKNREQYANDARDTLNGAIDSSQTTIELVDASEFPANGNFRLLMGGGVNSGGECMLCTARSGNTLTVVRGIEGTTAKAHSDSSAIDHVLTAGSEDRYGKDNVPLWGSTAPPLNAIASHTGGLLTSADFTWVNQGSAALSDAAGTMALRVPPSAGNDFRLAVRSAPATPYSLTVALQMFAPRDVSGVGGTGEILAGISARESSTGKLHTFCLNSGSSLAPRLTINDWSSTSAHVSARLALSNSLFVGSVLWLRLADDGANLSYSASSDGLEWIALLTHARNAYMTAPDQLGFCISNKSSLSADAVMRLLHWSTE